MGYVTSWTCKYFEFRGAGAPQVFFNSKYLFPPVGLSMHLPMASETQSTIPTSLLVFCGEHYHSPCFFTFYGVQAAWRHVSTGHVHASLHWKYKSTNTWPNWTVSVTPHVLEWAMHHTRLAMAYQKRHQKTWLIRGWQTTSHDLEYILHWPIVPLCHVHTSSQ